MKSIIYSTRGLVISSILGVAILGIFASLLFTGQLGGNIPQPKTMYITDPLTRGDIFLEDGNIHYNGLTGFLFR